VLVSTTTHGTTFEARRKPGRGVAEEITHPWQIHEVSGLKFRLRPGTVRAPNGQTWFVSNQDTEFEASDDTPTGYFVWLEIGLTTPNNPAITSVLYNSGTSIPPSGQGEEGDPGTIPPYIIVPLCSVATQGGVIDERYQYRERSLQLSLVVNNLSCDLQSRQILISDA
jgi:hypothetical protein